MSSHHTVFHRVGSTLRNINPSHIAQRSTTRKIMQQFAEQAGLVYFGSTGQDDEQHQPIRGYTLSTTSRDDHYSVGTIRGYAIALVERQDTARSTNEASASQRWLIAAVALYTRHDIPYMFISPRQYASAHPHYTERPLRLGVFGSYSPEFEQRFVIYGEPGRAVEIERYITPDIANVLVSHFKECSIEVSNGTVYLYANTEPSIEMLDMLVSNAVWFGAVLDVFAEQLAAARAKL